MGSERVSFTSMPRLLAHLLLSAALIFQGMGSACAYGTMAAGGDIATSADPASMAMMAMPCADMAGAQDFPGGHDPGQDCMQLCAMPARLPGMAFSVSPLLLPEPMALVPNASLADYTQAPPTPPPIA